MALSYIKTNFFIDNVTIIHNQNGAPFQLGWTSKSSTKHKLKNIVVKPKYRKNNKMFNLSLFANSGGNVDVNVELSKLNISYPDYLIFHKCQSNGQLPLVYLNGAQSQLTLRGSELDLLPFKQAKASCGNGQIQLDAKS